RSWASSRGTAIRLAWAQPAHQPAVGTRSPARKRSRACAGVRSATGSTFLTVTFLTVAFLTVAFLTVARRRFPGSALHAEGVRAETEALPGPAHVPAPDQPLQALAHLLAGQAGAVHQLAHADGAVLHGRARDGLVHVDVGDREDLHVAVGVHQRDLAPSRSRLRSTSRSG